MVSSEHRFVFVSGLYTLSKRLSYVRILALALLLFNGTGALYGGMNLMLYPDGSGLRMNTGLLRYAPFRDFVIPGLVLFVVNGLLSVIIALFTIVSRHNYERYIICQGVILLVWLTIQIAMIRTLDVMHLLMGVTGVGIILCGVWLGWLMSKNKG